MKSRRRVLLLGPQRPTVHLGQSMRNSGLDASSIGVISAGWQEAEGDIDVLRRETSHPMTDLGLYASSSELFARDKALHTAYRERQERLGALQKLYRLRLKQHAIALRQTLRAEGPPAIIAPERRHAVSQLRALDRHHLRQVDKAHLRFDAEFNADNNTLFADVSARVRETLDAFDTLMICGGNLPVLLNRMRLFGVDKVLAEKNLVAWSAGSMLLGKTIVLFHERLPQGQRDTEVLDMGFGLLPKTIIMPDARNRLRTGNKLRMSALSRRFSPATCCLLNNQSEVLFESGELVASHAGHYPSSSGGLKPLLAS